MKEKPDDRLTRAHLAFFGKIAASISHEIKNKLAILKEEAGLINDLFLMEEKGRPLDLDRLRALTQKIEARLDAVDDIAKRLSSFAHSVDQPVRTFDLRDCLALSVQTCQRFGAMKKVELTLDQAPNQVQVTNNPFLLLHIMYAIIDTNFQAAGEGGKLIIVLSDAGDSATITVSISGPACRPLSEGDLPEPTSSLLARFGATLTIAQDGKSAELRLPKELGELRA